MHLRVKKEREKWRKDRDTGKKGINDLTERGKCAQIKNWREAKKAARAKAGTTVELFIVVVCEYIYI